MVYMMRCLLQVPDNRKRAKITRILKNASCLIMWKLLAGFDSLTFLGLDEMADISRCFFATEYSCVKLFLFQKLLHVGPMDSTWGHVKEPLGTDQATVLYLK